MSHKTLYRKVHLEDSPDQEPGVAHHVLDVKSCQGFGQEDSPQEIRHRMSGRTLRDLYLAVDGVLHLSDEAISGRGHIRRPESALQIHTSDLSMYEHQSRGTPSFSYSDPY